LTGSRPFAYNAAAGAAGTGAIMMERTQAGEKFQTLVDIMARLRAPDGCPWDREQDAKSIAGFFLEEVFEAVDALFAGDAPAAAEELGDVLMEIVFLSRIYEEKGAFTVADALDGINRKLVRRHPHVFGDEKAETSRHVLDIWNRRKAEEKKRGGPFEGLSNAAPAALAAFQIGQRAAQKGFDWPDPAGAIDKVREELGELEAALRAGRAAEAEEELGDALFALAQAARLLKINPEIALRRANAKFIGRFGRMAEAVRASGRRLEDLTLEEMEEVWRSIKTDGR
jgi:MazG family protein